MHMEISDLVCNDLKKVLKRNGDVRERVFSVLEGWTLKLYHV